MFSKNSRYKKLSDTVTTDARGRRLGSKTLRMVPDVAGTFRYVVEEGDRLDHLAYKAYKDSTKWWRICDANPEFMSPQAMVGKEPLVTISIRVTFPGEGDPPWCDLIRNLSALVGVEDASIVDDIRLVEREMEYEGDTITYTGERAARSVAVVFNRMNMRKRAIVHEIRALGFNTGEPFTISRVGKKIVLPPDVQG
ncbi:hypothetical protein [Syntrophorhabdus aromaticivorans]|jgi:hypothetical protein|uniref:hypothetical protein n=1 Tax=Syntrophorhabdus aromaticivorans TaxID=328301 RepID=UPI000401D181|nr:hypothetical protein [Syntrophorhabdus aromaticivorans]